MKIVMVSGCEGCESGERVKSVMVSGCEGCESMVVRGVRVVVRGIMDGRGCEECEGGM